MAKVKLISKLNHSVIISYDGKGLVIPPYGTIEVENNQLLGAIPKGVLTIKEKNSSKKSKKSS